jgi:hypothetical protein
MRVALGLKARTGRAIVVAIGAVPQSPILERSELPLLPPGDFAPYHAAESLSPAVAEESVRRSIAAAHQLAEAGIRRVIEGLSSGGHEVCCCGVLVGPGMPPWSTQEILAVHVRMHQAEGVLFREVLLTGSRACGLQTATLREKMALEDAAAVLRVTRVDLDARLAKLGKSVGPPWGKDQKEAAAAALAALDRRQSGHATAADA